MKYIITFKQYGKYYNRIKYFDKPEQFDEYITPLILDESLKGKWTGIKTF